jgi:SH3-like domain-containing protein
VRTTPVLATDGGSWARSLANTLVLGALLHLVVALGGSMATAQTAQATGLPVPRFVSLAADTVNVRFGPGQQYPVHWLFQRRGLPVKIVAEFDVWRRIQDHEGDEGWVHSSLLSGRRTVMVQGGELQPLRRTPSAEARMLARVEPGVIGELFDCQTGFCLVEVDGRRGWLDAGALWGVLEEDLGG